MKHYKPIANQPVPNPHPTQQPIPTVPRAGLLDLPPVPTQARFPLRISEDARRLVDADGTPFLFQGDAAWSLAANLTYEEAIRYLDTRQAQGFNALMVNIIEHTFSEQPPNDRFGNAPFSDPMDMSTPQDAYFDQVMRLMDACRDRGFLMMLYPCFLGARFPDIGHLHGWYDEIVATGVEGCRKYGEYIGKKFGHYDNVMWCMGGDYFPEEAGPGLDAIVEGIKSSGAKGLFTAHGMPEMSPIECFDDPHWLDVNNTYACELVHRFLLTEWQRERVLPNLLIECAYEGEHNATDLQIRRQAYWSVFCGSNGHVMGNYPMWVFWTGWEEALDSPGAIAMARWGEMVRSIRWYDLVPDLEFKLVVGGIGEDRGLDRLTAAKTQDGTLGAAYIPSQRPIAVDLASMKGPKIRVEWFEPASGYWVNGGIMEAREIVQLCSPFMEDSVLVLTSMPAA